MIGNTVWAPLDTHCGAAILSAPPHTEQLVSGSKPVYECINNMKPTKVASSVERSRVLTKEVLAPSPAVPHITRF